jgi:hypothetical protein
MCKLLTRGTGSVQKHQTTQTRQQDLSNVKRQYDLYVNMSCFLNLTIDQARLGTPRE